ncbi:hypothetical protein K466DRAFT_604060 [Polyporus arcularius HHB13444]|uniref:F-box domain-containing protein n=1 Tax=Polyporus arcularius HHB13444 TaxID=1314778 RepID=A0A5C3NXZ4_9APHY|nr:hypothetical protein K466DRAFT_604060 [Polyporus arcularius HHB13444]
MHDLRAKVGEEINARVGVNTLPNELIMDVFKHVLSDVDPCHRITLEVDESDESAGVQTRPLLWLTHVCRRWRRVALAHPILWQRIDCRDPEQLQEFALRRSHPGPFSLFVDVPRYHESDDKDALRSVLMSSDRLQRLDIAHDLTKEPVLYPWLLDMQCPSLECLTVAGYPPDALLTNTEPPVIVLRKSLFCGGLSRLRALAISPIPDWLPSNPLPALTHLYLSFHWDSDLRTVTLLSFLCSAPALEVLHVSHFPNLHEYDELVVGPTPFSLNRLKYILLSNKSSFQSAFALLGQLIIPASARIYIHWSNTTYSDDYVSTLPPLPSTADSDRLAVHTGWDRLQVAAEGRDSGFWLDGRDSSHTGTARIETWLTHIPTMFPLSRLSHLQLQARCPGSTVVQVLREAVALRTLEIGICLYLDEHPQDEDAQYDVGPLYKEFDGSKDSLVLVSHALSEETGDVEPIPRICPELRSLTISLDSGSMFAQVFYGHWMAAIRSMLLARARLRRPIRRLAVQPIDLTPEDICYDDRVEFIDEVLADYAALAEHVEEYVLHGSGEEPIAFPQPGEDWDEVGRYWTIPKDDRPRLDIY